jgi:hypothetical protein
MHLEARIGLQFPITIPPCPLPIATGFIISQQLQKGSSLFGSGFLGGLGGKSIRGSSSMYASFAQTKAVLTITAGWIETRGFGQV